MPAEQLDREFFALAEMDDVTDVDELNRALDRAVGLRTFLTADDRIEKVAAFVANHFTENVAPLGYGCSRVRARSPSTCDSLPQRRRQRRRATATESLSVSTTPGRKG